MSEAAPDPYRYGPPDLTARDARLATPVSSVLVAGLEYLLPGYCPNMTYDASDFGQPSEGADAPPVP